MNGPFPVVASGASAAAAAASGTASDGPAVDDHLRDEGDPVALPRRAQVPGARGRYVIHTWGCQMNVHDSERMAAQLEAMGFTHAERDAEADVVLLNTCTVRETAAAKVHGKLGELQSLKRRRAHLVVGVCGCLAQQDRDALFDRAPHVDLVIGPRAIPELGSHLATVLRTRERVRDTAPWTDRVGEGSEAALRETFPKAYVTVQEGCDKFCTFCVVPFTRGRERCRPMDVILREVRMLLGRGFREVELLGQNVNAYRDDTGKDLADLLLSVAELEGVARVRFVTSHPRHLSDRIIAAMTHERVARGLHLPVQSGSDAVLRRMAREYTRADYLGLVERLRRALPDLALYTDVIVGFPGETEQELAETLTLLAEVGYEGVYSFRYSARPFTRASKTMSDDVPEAVKADRLARLQAFQDALQAPRDAARVGRVEEVLVEGMSKRSARDVTGRTSRNRVVNFEGGPELIGSMVPVRLTEARPHSFRGVPVGPPR